MVHEFGNFELDELRRELRHEGREVPLQPRVFDVLTYLVQQRDRVVGKDELLDRIWPDVVISDGSLKRAVSLARSALRAGGLGDAIRSYPRRGYRFDGPEVRSVATREGPPLPEPLAQARRAYADGTWEQAAAAFALADASDPLQAPDLERWSEALQLAGNAVDARAPLERAIAAHGSANDRQGVARTALGLALIHFERMDLSVAKGWLARARKALGSENVSREHGMLAGLSARFLTGDGEFEQAEREAERAIALGQELEDADIEALGMSYLGLCLVARGEIDRGLAIHDEAAATVLADGSNPTLGGMVYCGLIWTCRNRGDWERALEWTESFTRWCTERSIHLYSGACRMHRAEVLQFTGDVVAAEKEALSASELLARLGRYEEGDACRVLGDLRLQRGDLDGAERAYRRSHEVGWDPQPGYSLLLAARGRPDAALRALERSLGETRWATAQRRSLLLAAIVGIAIAANDPTRARQALDELDDHPDGWRSTAHAACVAQARADYLVYEGRLREAIGEMREAVRAWHRVGSPLHAARCRLRLAELYALDHDRDAAELELDAADPVIRTLGAHGLASELARVRAAVG